MGINLNYDGGLDGSVQYFESSNRRLPLSSVQHSVPPRVKTSSGSRTKHLHELAPIIKNTVFPLTTEGNESNTEPASGFRMNELQLKRSCSRHKGELEDFKCCFYTFWEMFQRAALRISISAHRL